MTITYRHLNADQQRAQIEQRVANLEREHWDNHLTLKSLQGQPAPTDPQAQAQLQASINQIQANLATIEAAHKALHAELDAFVTEANAAGVGTNDPGAVTPEPTPTDAQPE